MPFRSVKVSFLSVPTVAFSTKSSQSFPSKVSQSQCFSCTCLCCARLLSRRTHRSRHRRFLLRKWNCRCTPCRDLFVSLFQPAQVQIPLGLWSLHDCVPRNTGRNTLRELTISQLKDADTPEKHRNCVIPFGERQLFTCVLTFADFNMFNKVSQYLRSEFRNVIQYNKTWHISHKGIK